MNIKKSFFDYIGPEKSLANYVKSYKLVFLKVLLELADVSGKARVFDVAMNFKQFYEGRKSRGLPPDVNVDNIIENIESATISQVTRVIKENPYAVFQKQGYLNINFINGEEYFCFNQELYKELSNDDKENLKLLLDKKIDNYFSIRVDNMAGEKNKMNRLKKYFDEVLSKYYEARTSQQFSSNPMGRLVRNEIKDEIAAYDFIDNSTYRVHGSVGQGSWAAVPWVAILDNRITTTTQRGVYIVYLFSNDMERLYLTLIHGFTELNATYGKRKAVEKMKEIAHRIHSMIKTDRFKTDNNVKTGHELYEEGCIFYKEYQAGNIPGDEILIDDLRAMVEIYQNYYDFFERQEIINNESILPTGGDVVELATKQSLQAISDYIKNKGFTYEYDLINNFYLSLKSKPFVILAGTSGTGKSKLVKLFAEAVGATAENGRYRLVPVKPDWSDATDLLGYRDLHGKFHPGLLTSFVKRAMDDMDRPYFICLDEMNLARVEYYFSDVLSVMETRYWKNERIVTDKLIPEELFGDEEAKSEYGDLYIPENLYIIGTVNMDETTFPFSKKVLDRANTIEFSQVDFDYDFINKSELKSKELDNRFFRSDFLQLGDCSLYEETIKNVIFTLKEINDKLIKSNLHFGYRIRDEICYYTVYGEENEISSFDNSMDNEILQKILPRIQGSSMAIKRALIDLFKLCIANQNENFNYEDSSNNMDMFKYIEEHQNIPYVKSAMKLAFMMRRFEEDGFTSYWL